ncbi:MAG: COG4315 family predicted lipoprotein [Solirubrobacterales bacterium]
MARFPVILGTCALLAIGAGCGGDDDSADEGGSAASATTAEASKEKSEGGSGGGKDADAGSGSLVDVGDSEFGQILTDSDGRTLYAFDKETTDRSECFGACAEAWPPFYTEGTPRAGNGVDQKLLGTTEHEGKELVTYNGQPLYYYVDDGPNEVLCQGVDEFGGLWLVVDPGGDAIQ